MTQIMKDCQTQTSQYIRTESLHWRRWDFEGRVGEEPEKYMYVIRHEEKKVVVDEKAHLKRADVPNPYLNKTFENFEIYDKRRHFFLNVEEKYEIHNINIKLIL